MIFSYICINLLALLGKNNFLRAENSVSGNVLDHVMVV